MSPLGVLSEAAKRLMMLSRPNALTYATECGRAAAWPLMRLSHAGASSAPIAVETGVLGEPEKFALLLAWR